MPLSIHQELNRSWSNRIRNAGDTNRGLSRVRIRLLRLRSQQLHHDVEDNTDDHHNDHRYQLGASTYDHFYPIVVPRDKSLPILDVLTVDLNDSYAVFCRA